VNTPELQAEHAAHQYMHFLIVFLPKGPHWLSWIPIPLLNHAPLTQGNPDLIPIRIPKLIIFNENKLKLLVNGHQIL
jgi:hypothetical protein